MKKFLIVGAGPVGLVAAIKLTARNHSVRIVDKRPERTHFSKAIAINPRTLQILDEFGISAEIVSQGVKIPNMNFRNSFGNINSIPFSAGPEVSYPFIVANPQNITEKILENKLNELGVEVEYSKEFEGFEERGATVISKLKGENTTHASDFVYGSDGSRSDVRDSLGIAFSGSRMPEKWSLADVGAEVDLPYDRANIELSQQYLFFIMKMAEGRYRLAANIPNILENIPSWLHINRVDWKSEFDVNHKIASNFGSGNIFIGGDAAHVHSPLGGRGMNLGIEDASSFVDLFSEGKLERYSRLRREAAKKTENFVRLQTFVLASPHPAAHIFRSKIFPTISGIKPVQKALTKRIMGLI